MTPIFDIGEPPRLFEEVSGRCLSNAEEQLGQGFHFAVVVNGLSERQHKPLSVFFAQHEAAGELLTGRTQGAVTERAVLKLSKLITHQVEHLIPIAFSAGEV